MRNIHVVRQISQISGDQEGNWCSTHVILILKCCKLGAGLKKDACGAVQTSFEVPEGSSWAGVGLALWHGSASGKRMI